MMARRTELETWLEKVVLPNTTKGAPATVYHYTKWESFCGIVRDQKFRHTLHRHTNDEQELKSIDKDISDIAREVSRNLTFRDGFKRFLDEYERKRAAVFLDVYLASFSLLGDDGRHWAEYADGGTGICLGMPILDTGEVLDEHSPNDVGRGAYRVSYSINDWKRDVQAGFWQVGKAIDGHVRKYPSDREWARDRCWAAISRLAAFWSIYSKAERWNHEQEWRAIAIPSENYTGLKIEGPPHKQYVALHVRACGQRIAFSRIALGPSCSRTKEDVREVFRQFGYPAAEIPAVVRSSVLPGDGEGLPRV